MKDGMNVVDEDGEIAMVIYSLRREGDKLVMDGKALGTMRMDMIITSEEAVKGLGIALGWQTISFALLLPYFLLRNLFKKRESSGNQG
jgi:hypothetical protein